MEVHVCVQGGEGTQYTYAHLASIQRGLVLKGRGHAVSVLRSGHHANNKPRGVLMLDSACVCVAMGRGDAVYVCTPGVNTERAVVMGARGRSICIKTGRPCEQQAQGSSHA